MIIDFKNQTAVVTGGAGGIGTACVRNLLESNAKVAVLDISKESIGRIKEELKDIGVVEGYVADITRVDSITAVIEQIRKDMGEIKVLIQTAGLLRGQKGLSLTEQEWDLMMNINAKGMFFVMQQVVEQSMKNGVVRLLILPLWLGFEV